ncbi:MAG TPA: hypothetical protein VLE21_04785 [Candidatus Nitrosocosmicus sp.]|nr:hypothetical protein [Candidatus Nitrosocosmicus sp.]
MAQLLSPIGTPAHESKKVKEVKPSRVQITPFKAEKTGFGYRVSPFQEAKPNKVTLTVSQVDKLIGETPYPSFDQLWQYKTDTPQLDTIITYETDLIVGTDLNINSDDEEAKKILDKWSNEISLFEKIKTHTAVALATGFGLLVKVRQNKELVNIEEFDIRTISKAFRDLYGNVIAYEQKISNDGKYIYYFVSKEKLNTYASTFSTERYDIESIPLIFKRNGRSFAGLSEFHALAIPRTVGNRESRPLAEAMWSLDDVVIGTLENFAYPTEYHVYEGANDDELLAEAQKIKDSKPGDKFIVSKKVEIDRREPTQAKFDAFINHFKDVLQHGTGFPLDMLTGDFSSRASSQTADSFFMRKIRSYQKSLTKLVKKEIMEDKLRSLGWDEKRIEKANITLEFETESSKDYTPEIVANRVSMGLWTKNEGREYDKSNGQNLFEDDKIEEDEELNNEIKKTQLIPKDDNKIKPEDKKKLEYVRENVRKCKMCKEHQHALCDKKEWCKCTHSD